MNYLKINGKNININVNGKKDMTLLWFLREYLQLSGTKFGCGKALCGACSVMMDGISVRSCQLKVKDVIGSEITTIEGIKPTHPIIVAWQKNQVPQCGYCQSGQIISAISLLKENKNPSEQEIIYGMNGNICRCGTYMRIKKTIKEVSQMKGAEI